MTYKYPAIATFYAKQINRGAVTIDGVPELFKTEVKAKYAELFPNEEEL